MLKRWLELKKKLLVLGASGLTGYKIANLAKNSYEIYCTYNTRPIKLDFCEEIKLDITNYDQVSEIFSLIKPEIVINTTALHNVDFCEENPDKANSVNVKSVKTLSENTEKFDSKLIHISTDYVFDGISSRPYSENDNPKPLGVYAKSKLDGEKLLNLTKHVVIRPSVVYGWTPLELAGIPSSSGKPMNFALWALTKLNKNKSIKIVTDQFATATLADSLAKGILKIAQSDKSGLYHVSGLSCESRFDFTIKLAKKFGYDTSLILPVSSSEFKQKAKRPAYSCLNCEKAIKEFGLKLLTTNQALDIMKEQVKKEAPQYLANN